MTDTAAPRPSGRARRNRATWPRPLPRTTPLHRMWTGTKIILLTVLTTALVLWPTWWTVGAVGLTLALTALLMRTPPSAYPRIPTILWAMMFGGLIGATIGGGFWLFLRTIVLSLEIVWGALLFVWSTPTDHVAPAYRVLLRPLRWLRLPVDEWVDTLEFGLRGLPTLRDEMANLTDAVRLRTKDGRLSARDGWRGWMRQSIDIATAALSTATRRAADTGRAMTLRGGIRPVESPKVRLGWRDFAGFAAVAIVVAVAVVLRDGWPF